MPNLREPCGECHGVARHQQGCPRKRSGKVSGLPSAEVFRLRIQHISDALLGDYLRACATEAAERRKRIQSEASERIARLDEVLPVVRVSGGAVAAVHPTVAGSVRAAQDRAAEAAVARAAAPPNTDPATGLPSREERPAPQNAQCPAVHPEKPALKCTQQKGHEGQHHNHSHRLSWQRRST